MSEGYKTVEMRCITFYHSCRDERLYPNKRGQS